ncbi:MAG TPA: hypothetical protein PLB18_15620 [Acidobacteriota bacterium]|nr:hypothetical protein [Acidobacteriota bacterium]
MPLGQVHACEFIEGGEALMTLQGRELSEGVESFFHLLALGFAQPAKHPGSFGGCQIEQFVEPFKNPAALVFRQ